MSAKQIICVHAGSCVHSYPVINKITGDVITLDCNPPMQPGDRKSTRGNCVFYEREPGSDDDYQT